MINGFSLVRHFDPDFTPCGCVTHVFYTVPCTSVYEKRLIERVSRTMYLDNYARVCAACGAVWATEPVLHQTDHSPRLRARGRGPRQRCTP